MMPDPYKELKELDYEAYVKAIEMAAALTHNIDYAGTWKGKRDVNIEREIVAYTISVIRRRP
jgi:hypothetical protein